MFFVAPLGELSEYNLYQEANGMPIFLSVMGVESTIVTKVIAVQKDDA